MLGYADTDLVTLFLPLLIGLAPAVWVMHFLRHPLALPFRWFQRWTKRPIPIALDAPGHQPYAPISAFWVFTLSASRAARLVVSGMAFHVPVHRAL